ncbi:MAG: hypothetical protein R3A44_06030 [Caldilineaceae bacterium]
MQEFTLIQITCRLEGSRRRADLLYFKHLLEFCHIQPVIGCVQSHCRIGNGQMFRRFSAQLRENGAQVMASRAAWQIWPQQDGGFFASEYGAFTSQIVEEGTSLVADILKNGGAI